MSKNIIIQEGGIGKQLTADKLKTNLVGGGTCLWVPEDETRLGTKYISENGTYKANDDGYYGYSEVTVSGIGTATGTGPDGETHSYSEDGDGGITDTILPDSIIVATPPTVTTYADGAIIDFSGMVVKGRLKSGGAWSDANHPNGVIPINELNLPVTVADASQATSYSEATSEYDQTPVAFGAPPVTWGDPEWTHSVYTGGSAAAAFRDNSIVMASSGAFTFQKYELWGSDPTPHNVIEGGTGSYTLQNKTVYYAGITVAFGDTINLPINTEKGSYIAWTMIYGTITREAGTQTIPVNYARNDGSTLTASFDITVDSSLGGATGGGGEAGDTGAGRND